MGSEMCIRDSINLTLYKLEEIANGSLQQIIDPLLSEHQADLLAEMGN